MPNTETKITVGIDFEVNKAGLNSLQSELAKIQQTTLRDFQNTTRNSDMYAAEKELNEIKSTAAQVQTALQKAFNVDLGTVNITRFSQELKNLDLNTVYNQFSRIGITGQNAFRNLTAELLSTNTQLKQSHTILDSMADTMSRTVKWGVASSMMNRLTGSVQEAYGYVKSLDTSLNNIRIVTQKSAEDMAEFAVQANNAAKALGSSTTDYTNASLIYYQQGLSDEEVAARTDVTLKTANVTGQTAREVSEELTAVWNGYQKTSAEAESSIDVLAAVAANTASNLEELATGMSTVASAANTMGVSEEQLAAQLSTIISATRQGPEMTGRALRTIYARMSTINAGGIDEEDGATLTSYTAKMDKFGISVLDASGKLRDMGDVIEEIGGKWNDFTREQQVAIAQAMAGTRQYNNIMALFENWDEYQRALDIASNSVGTLQQQQDTYMESTAAHLQQLETAWEDVFDSLLSGSDINALVDVFTDLVSTVADFIDSIGGAAPLLTTLGSVGLNVFSNQIGRGLSNMITNLQAANQGLDEQNAKLALAQKYGMDLGKAGAGTGIDTMYQQAEQLYSVNTKLTQEEREQFNVILQQEAALENNKAEWNDQIDSAQRYLENMTQIQEATVTTSAEGVKSFNELDTELYKHYIEEIHYSLEDAVRAAERLKNSLEAAPISEIGVNTSNAYANLREQLSKFSTNGLSESDLAIYREYQSVLTNVTSSAEAVQEAESGLQKMVKNADDATKQQIDTIIKASQEYRNYAQAQKDSAEAQLAAKQQADQLLHTLKDTTPEYQLLKGAMTELNQAERAGDPERLTEAWKNVSSALDKAAVAARNYGLAAEKLLSQQMDGYAIGLARDLGGLQKSFENLYKTVSNEAMYTNLINVVSGLGRVASGIMMIQNLGNIINNEDLSAFEKMTQLAMNLGMALGMILPAIKSLRVEVVQLGKDFSGVINAGLNFVSMLGAGPAALIAAGIAGIAVAAWALYESFTANEKAAERAAKSAEALADRNNEVATSLTNLKNQVDAYDSARKEIDNCTAGTEEWRDALSEANDAAIDLLDTLSGLSGDDIRSLYSRDSNGLINIDTDKLQSIVKDYQKVADNMEVAAALGQYNASQAAIKSGATNAARQATSSEIPFLGSVSVPNPVNGWLTDVLTENIDQFVGLGNDTELAAEKLNALGISATLLGQDNFKALCKSVIELGNQSDAAAAKLALIAGLDISQRYGDEYDETVQKVLTNAYTQTAKNYNDNWQNVATNEIRLGRLSTDTSADSAYGRILTQLNEAGMNYTAATSNPVIGGKNNRSLAFQDENNNRVTLDAGEIGSIIGSAIADSLVEQNKDFYAEEVQQLRQSAIANLEEYIINDNFDNLTQSGLKALQDLIGGADATTEEVSSSLQNLLGESTSGLERLFGENYAAGISQAIASAASGFESIGDQLQNILGQKLFDGIDLSAVSLNAQQGLVDSLTSILSGINGTDVFQQFSNALAGMDSTALNSVIQAVMDLNEAGRWGSVTMPQFVAAIEDTGFKGEIATEDLYAVVAAMNSVGIAATDFSSNFSEIYSSIHSAVDGLSYGSKLTEQEFEKLGTDLSQIGVSIGNFFEKTIDGEYKLVAAAGDFQDAVQEALLKRYDNIIGQEQGRQENLQQIQDYYNAGVLTQNANKYASNNGLVAQNGIVTPNQSGDLEAYNNLIKAQIGAIQELGLADDELIDKWKALSAQGKLTAGDVNDIAQKIQENKDALENLNDEIVDSEAAQTAIREQLAASASSLSQLKEYLNQGRIEIEQYDAAAQRMFEANRTSDLDADAVREYSNYLYDVESAELRATDAFEKMSAAEQKSALESLAKTCKQNAIEIMNMNDGIQDLSKNIKTWSSNLKDATTPAQKVSEAISGLNKDLQKILDTSQEFGEGFLKENLDDIEKAAEGDEEAIERLRAACLDDIVLDIYVNNLDEDLVAFNEFQSQLAIIQDYLNNNNWDVCPEIDLSTMYDDETAFLDICNQMIKDAGLTGPQVKKMFKAMGFDAHLKEQKEDVSQEVPHYVMEHQVVPNGAYEVDYVIPGTEPGSLQTQHISIPMWKEENVLVEQGTEPVTGSVTPFGLDIDGEGGDIEIESITPSAGGSANNNSSKNRGSGGGKGGKGGGGKGGKGGGGGGGGSAQEPKVEEKIEDQADRYHDVNVRLQEISTSLSRLQGQESKLLGSNLISNLNRQLELLNQEIDTTTQKIAIAEDEAQEYRDKLTEKGVLFDANGDVSNYFDVMQQQLDYVNATIDSYNAMSAEEQEEFQETLDEVKEAYNQFVEDMSRYEEIIHDEIPSYYDDIQSDLDEEIQINIQKFTMEVEIRLDMREAEKDWNEFYRKVVLGLSSDDIFGNVLQDMADVLSYFDTTATDVFHRRGNDIEDWVDAIEDAMSGYSDTGTLDKLAEQIEDTIDQLETIEGGGMASVYGDNEAQALEDLQNYYTELMNELEDIYDLVDDIKDEYLDMIDEAIDKFDKQVDQYEYINDLLNHDVTLIGLLYGDDAYAEMARYYQQIEDNNNQELDFLRKRVDFAYEMMQAETDDDAREKWEEEWEDALSQLNDKVEDSVQNIIDKYCNAIAQIIDELNDAVTNGLGLEYVSDEWDLMNQEADIYLDKINEMYAIQDIRNKYLDAIDATDSLYAQQKLNEAMEMELSYLEEKDNLTQSDVDRAELLYEITLKQIALDEAQQNKSTMRLRRDSQGNYSYQYVSDQDETAQLQQELLDLQNQLYNFDLNAYKENLDDLYSVYEEFQERLLELYQDQTLSAEEREQQIALYVEYYGNIINDLVTENTYLRMNLEQSAVEELATLYETDVENFRNMSEEEIDELMNNLVPQWDSGIQHMADTFAGEGGFIPTCTDAFEQLDQATLDYQDSLDTLEATAGVDFASIATGYDTNIALAQDLLAGNEALIQSYKDMIIVLQTLIEELQDFLEMSDMDYYIRQAANGYNYYQEMEENMRDAAQNQDYSTSTVVATIPTEEEETPTQEVSETPTATGTGNGIVEVGDTATYTGGLYYSDSYGATPTGSRGAGGTVTITQVYSDGRPYPIHVTSTNSAYGWLKESQLSGYDTGGYTGEWGSSGALALLHQKELVLNPSDTENILNAVGLVRDISTLLDKLDTSVINRVMTMKEEMLSGINGKFENGNPEIDQHVDITANFPNVRDSHEIEDALNNLVNHASQYAYRTA